MTVSALDPARLVPGTGRVGTWWAAVEVVATTGSTNADLAAAARAGARAPRALLTLDQSAGRGRLNRRWTAPAGTALACSILLVPAVPPERWTWLPLLAGLVVSEALGDLGATGAMLKWPNDVLLPDPARPAATTRKGNPEADPERNREGDPVANREGSREGKVCGVLAERVETPGGPACVLGMGINLSQSRSELPVPTATSLALAGVAVDPTDVALALLARWADAVPAWQRDDAAVRRDYAERCVTLGRRVRVLLPGGDVEGTARGVDAAGRLELETAAGVRGFSAGDVVHLR